MIEKELVVIINGAGTNGMELKALQKELEKNDLMYLNVINIDSQQRRISQ